MPENAIKLLMACSIETSGAIEQALIHHGNRVFVRRVDTAQDLRHALENPEWHLIFSDLVLSDFSALDLANLLSEKAVDIPLVVIKGTGAEEIAFRCLDIGRGPVCPLQ